MSVSRVVNISVVVGAPAYSYWLGGRYWPYDIESIALPIGTVLAEMLGAGIGALFGKPLRGAAIGGALVATIGTLETIAANRKALPSVLRPSQATSTSGGQ